jgi:DNA-binding response OmpR family regulator
MSIRVLLADPDPDLLEIIDDSLSDDEFEILTAATGPDCAEILRRCKPDVLVMELDLPGDWSNRLLSMMRTALEIPEVPTVILSRFNEDQSIYLDWPSVKKFLVKPISMLVLKAGIRSAILR